MATGERRIEGNEVVVVRDVKPCTIGIPITTRTTTKRRTTVVVRRERFFVMVRQYEDVAVVPVATDLGGTLGPITKNEEMGCRTTVEYGNRRGLWLGG